MKFLKLFNNEKYMREDFDATKALCHRYKEKGMYLEHRGNTIHYRLTNEDVGPTGFKLIALEKGEKV